MDLDGLLDDSCVDIEGGAIRTVAVDTPEPSAFCHEILNANPYAYLDDAPLEERRARAVQLRRTYAASTSTAPASSIRPRSPRSPQESWPLVRDADELHDALATLVVVPPVARVERVVRRARREQRRATTLCAGDARILDVRRAARARAAWRIRTPCARSRRSRPLPVDAAAGTAEDGACRDRCAAGSNRAARSRPPNSRTTLRRRDEARSRPR